MAGEEEEGWGVSRTLTTRSSYCIPGTVSVCRRRYDDKEDEAKEGICDMVWVRKAQSCVAWGKMKGRGRRGGEVLTDNQLRCTPAPGPCVGAFVTGLVVCLVLARHTAHGGGGCGQGREDEGTKPRGVVGKSVVGAGTCFSTVFFFSSVKQRSDTKNYPNNQTNTNTQAMRACHSGKAHWYSIVSVASSFQRLFNYLLVCHACISQNSLF